MDLPLPLRVITEHGIEALLRLDPDARARLVSLEDKVIAINVTSPEVRVVLSVSDSRIHCIGAIDTPADTTFTGTLAALTSMTDGNDALYKGEVLVEGDLGVAQQLKDVIALLDPDWQEWLSPVFGDSVVHQLGVGGSMLGDWAARTRGAMAQNTADYLQEEAELLAPNSEVYAYCADVDEIRANADRLEARVNRIENARQLQLREGT